MVSGASGEAQDDTEHELQVELTRRVLSSVAPEELEILPEVVVQFFAKPESIEKRLQPREYALAFGADISLLAPYVLAASGPVLNYIGSVLADSAKDAVKEALTSRIRRALQLRKGTSPLEPSVVADSSTLPPNVLSADQCRRVRGIAVSRSLALGLPPSQAELLADAFVGSLTGQA